MGQCVTKEDLCLKCEQQIIINSPGRKHKSKLLDDNLRNQIIFEEESYQFSNSNCSNEESSRPNLTLKGRTLGYQISYTRPVLLKNSKSNRKLHSHCVKNQLKEHEVVLCKEQTNEYDDWLFIEMDKYHLIQHELTKQLLTASKSLVYCQDAIKSPSEDHQWVLEFSIDNSQLLTNAILRIKHMSTQMYLSSSYKKATFKDQVAVQLSVNADLWIIEESKS